MKKQALSIAYMFLITLFFASLVSAVKFLNEKKIETNQIVKLQRIILKVLDIPVRETISNDDLAQLFTAQIKDIQIDQKALYIGYEPDGRTIQGYAVPVGGPGFWGPIEGLVGVTPDATKVLGLWVHLGITVHFRSGGQEESSALGPRQTQGFVRAQRPHLQRLNGQFEVVDRARGGSKVQHCVQRSIEVEILCHVLLDKAKALVSREVLNVPRAARNQVVHGDDLVSLAEEPVTQMRSEEPGTARDQNALHVCLP